MRGKLIIIEAGDGSGKATQTRELYSRLKSEGHRVRRVEFPDYESDSSALIKMYLKGEFGSNPEDVNPYVASTFYAVDRYASFKKGWGDFYKNGGIIIADRYTTSNMVHQAAKIDDEAERECFLDWLWDLEFAKFNLPRPDAVIFLDMPPKEAQRLIQARQNSARGQIDKDIHEGNRAYLERSYKNACGLAAKYNWHRIECFQGSRLKTVSQIHAEVYKFVVRIVNN